MSLLSRFLRDHHSVTSKYCAMVMEDDIAAEKAAEFGGLAGARHTINVPLVLSFTIDKFGENTASFHMRPAGYAGATDCYFLPFLQDKAITMQLGTAARYFFTSSLTGCTVQVDGPRNAPTVTHANAATAYLQNIQQEMTRVRRDPDTDDLTDQNVLDDLDDAETQATLRTQASINALLPAALGAAAPRTATKDDYLNKLTRANLRHAKRNFRLKKWRHSLEGFGAKKSQGWKPRIGGFVYGILTPHVGWTFYLQSSVDVVGTRKTGFLGAGVKRKTLINEAVSLGRAEQFYP